MEWVGVKTLLLCRFEVWTTRIGKIGIRRFGSLSWKKNAPPNQWSCFLLLLTGTRKNYNLFCTAPYTKVSALLWFWEAMGSFPLKGDKHLPVILGRSKKIYELAI